MKEQTKIITLAQLCNGKISNKQAAIELGLSIRQVQRKKKAYLENGAASIKHGNYGKNLVEAIVIVLKKSLELVTKLPKITNNLTRKMAKEELAKKRSEYGRKGAQNSPWRTDYINGGMTF